jgi:hypothetical protein
VSVVPLGAWLPPEASDLGAASVVEGCAVVLSLPVIAASASVIEPGAVFCVIVFGAGLSEQPLVIAPDKIRAAP